MDAGSGRDIERYPCNDRVYHDDTVECISRSQRRESYSGMYN